nr:sialic acid-binding Ig-like lectin 10 isoform X2 [Pseudochaenichthys georgianus]
MILTASGFVVFLLCMPAVQSQYGWGVTYSSTNICAVNGSTVEISCIYTYPSKIYRYDNTVQKTFWFTQRKDGELVDLKTDSEYAGRVEDLCENNICTLKIRNLRESDSAEYRFRFKTNQPDVRFAASPGVTLSVTDPDLLVNVMETMIHQSISKAKLQCRSRCLLPHDPSYIWYKNGQNIRAETSSAFSVYFDSADSFSCALKGHENFPSPSHCVRGQTCNRVIYNDRSICAFKGSSVDISCTYSNAYVQSKFWFRPERSHQGQNPSQPEDLSEDSQYAGRVQILETRRGRSTLRISDLRDSDSAQYLFKFRTTSFEWGSDLPGTTLTVTALQVQVITSTVHQSYTYAELKCRSGCSPAGVSYVWFKNEKIIKEQRPLYKDQFYPGDIIFCALKGHENYSSPLLYALKFPVVSVSPSDDIMEGSSVTLTCSSDANPAANYTWYKENGNQKLHPLTKERQLFFSSIQVSDSGEYNCTAENELGKRTSERISVDVKYAPKLPSVSASPSAEIEEGSSMTLTCSSDANPAANYTWYKEDKDSPKASGQTFTITDFRAEHSGSYSCGAQNKLGRSNSTLHLIVLTGAWRSRASGITTAVVLSVILLSIFLLIWKKKAAKRSSEPGEPNSKQSPQEELLYANVQFSKNQSDPLSSNIEDSVVYAEVKFNSAAPRSQMSATEDSTALYSTINTTRTQ